MNLSRRLLLASLLFALPAALLVVYAMNRLHARDAIARLEAVARGHIVDTVRDACLQDPMWFLAGPRLPRPRLDARNIPDPDVNLPRPSRDELPFEMFAYDDTYSPKSTAGPRFPDDFKRAMRAASSPPKQLSGEWSSNLGTGLQTAIVTGWGGDCSVLLFRQQPVESPLYQSTIVFAGIYALMVAVALLVATPVARRMRNLSVAVRKSASQDYTEVVPVTGSDEIGSLAAQFNDTAADIRRRIVDARDREELLQRHVENSTILIAEPLFTLERSLGHALAARRDPALIAALKESHRVAVVVENQAAVVRLRGITDASPREAINVAEVVAHVRDSRAPLAAAAGVTIDTTQASAPVTIQADLALIEQAVANVIDNAIIYNREGGSVRVSLHGYDHGKRFRLIVTDDGPGVSDEEFAGLTANRRFRGDEARSRRPGGRGLGLALAREISDRFGLQLDIRQPDRGGLEVEIATRS
jgi:signal transduction histidine kinase